jgi:mannose-6-phosphate isomerase-like protein (cupin superfamily)
MAEKLKLTPSESIQIVDSTPEALVVEVTYGPGGKAPPAHFHPEQDEHFEVVEGHIRTKIDGTERDFDPGATIEIPRGTVHQMWNPRQSETRMVWRTTPAGRTEEWFRAIDALHREGKVGSGGRPNPLAFGVLLDEYGDVFRLAGPDALLRPAVKGLGAIGRARGYSARKAGS